ncbi:MAG: response regulator [Proteobacteria bacterium]|nr:response regulator [Pseudomonadota bacterium]MBU1387607.1 response regulator [Pseudomonadota bacterium]MBU1544198.1 response regulator [Pseudomonadota bacterium]
MNQTTIPVKIGQLCEKAHIVNTDTPVSQVKSIFDNNKPVSCVVVMAHQQIAGMVMNIHLNSTLSQRYGFALFYNKPISRLMDVSPIIVPHSKSVEMVAEQAMQRKSDKLYDHIIVTEDDLLLGVVAVKTILDALTQAQKNHVLIQKKYTEKLEQDDFEKQQAIDKLEESKKTQQIVIDAIPHAIYWKNKDSIYIGCNQSFANDAGISNPKDIKGMTDDMLPWTEKETLVYQEQDKRIIKQNKSELHIHQIQTNAANQKQFLDTSKIPLHDTAGEVVGILCVYEDITLQLDNDNKRIQLEKQLARAQRMEAIGRLAGGVAHDLNNILSGIVNYPDLIMMDLPEDSPIIPSLKVIQKSGQRAAAVVHDLLTLARRGVTNNESLDLNTVIYQYLESPECLKLKTDFPDIQIRSRISSRPMTIEGSPVHLMKTLMNLVNNSAEAIKTKGQISICTHHACLDSPLRGYSSVREGEYVVLTVTDNGIGILEENIDKIFEPFYTNKKMGRSGTGLGMSVVWGTVKDHNGYIDISSKPFEQTTVTIYLPSKTAVLKPLQSDEISLNLMGDGQSILIVDDMPEQREIAVSYLKRLNYKVHAARSGEEAVEYIRCHPSDLVILDMIMEPGMDWLETYMKILEIQPGTPAVITSGFSESERVKKAQLLGAGPYIKKPYDFIDLGKAVKEKIKATG